MCSPTCVSPFALVMILNADTEGEDKEEAAGAVGIPSDKCILFLLLQSDERCLFLLCYSARQDSDGGLGVVKVSGFV